MLRPETNSVRQAQGALEAIEVLQDAGFVVKDFSIDTETEDSAFTLESDLSINRDERPLED